MNWALVDREGTCVNLPGSPETPAAKSILARIPRDSREEFARLLQDACADGARRRLAITRADRPLLVVDIVPLPHTQRGQSAALVILHDANEFDSAHSRLRRLARRNEAILRSAMDGFFVVDADCRFLEVNEAFCAMTGYSADELLQMRISDLEVEAQADGGVSCYTRTGLHRFPIAHRHKDGHIIQLEISINVLHDDGDKILVGFARDVTERMRAEAALARLTREQKLILDSAPDGIVGLDQEGRLTFANPAAARTLGTAAAELIGRAAHEVFFARGDDCATPDCPICAALRHGQGPLRAEGEFRRAAETFPAEFWVTPMHHEQQVVGAVLGFRDLTEIRRAEEERRGLQAQVQQAQKMESLGLLAGGIAHDLRNTLQGVQGHACMALEHAAEGTELHERLRRIIDACERAAKVIRQMLAYAGQAPCDAAPLDLNRLIEEMTDFMRAGVPEQISLHCELDPTLPRISADSGQLQQVITNLLVNAVEAIGERPGSITLSTRALMLDAAGIQQRFAGQELKPGLYAALEVSDTGRGMPPQTVRRIFEPFYSDKGPGRGLGLAAMHGIVRAHHGAVAVESTPGTGTRFTVVFPALAAERTAPQDGRPDKPGRGAPTILVIDDEDEVREVFRDMLADRGLNVLTAENGARGVEVFRRSADAIDVVLLDMTMPGKSGAQVCREILSIRPDAGVIVCSGYCQEIRPAEFGDARPAAFLEKPFTTDALMETIGEVLRRRAAVNGV